MHVQEPGSKSQKRARERKAARERRRETLTQMRQHNLSRLSEAIPTPVRSQRLRLMLSDIGWYLRRNPPMLRAAGAVVALLFVFFMLSHWLGGRIFPNVWALNVNLGGMSVDDAATALTTYWQNDVRIDLYADGTPIRSVTPAELGIVFDARQTAENARGVGMAGIPLGFSVEPVVSFDTDQYITAQNFILDLQNEVQYAPYNAGYELRDGLVIGVPGRDGRVLEVGQTIDYLVANPAGIVRTRRLDLFTRVVPPVVADPQPYLAQAEAFSNQNFRMIGYDPFEDEYVTWSTDRAVVISWLEASSDGLTLREDAFEPFFAAQNAALDEANTARYLDPQETRDAIAQAITAGESSAFLRIRYRPTTYTVVAGDTGFAIARKSGIPFFLIRDLNSGLNLDRLSIGDQILLPSRDVAIQVDPVPNKRIVVDLTRQYLVAYENGEQVFSWYISSGISEAPTSPGIFQILSHAEVAYGSSFTLCGTAGCGQWQMYWFMGIYEVEPGLMNGFHGAVLLPNGAYLGGGSVGFPYTFGCVMSEDGNARSLYEWADAGTMVEIISSEFAPQSELGERTLNQEIAASAEPGSSG